MTRFLAVAFFVFSLLPANAQDAAPKHDEPFLAGTIVYDPGSHPLKKVVVQAIAEDQRQTGTYSATSDGEGRFRIDPVTPGRYRMFLEKTGFIQVNGQGQKADMNTVTVSSGHSPDDMVFHMLPAAIITGRVIDEDGDPMPQVRVTAQRKVPGKAGRETDGMAVTNDLGEYRLTGLSPGQYSILALPPPDFRDYSRNDKSNASQDKSVSQIETRYVTTYYPGTFDSAQASLITIKAGEEMPINFNLTQTRTYCVRGVVSGLKPGQSVEVDLVSKLGDSASEVGSDGTFEIHGAAPGTYTLKAETGSDTNTMTARQEISVVAADVEDIKLVPMPSFALSGHLRIESQAAVDPARYVVNLRQADAPDNTGAVFMSQDFFGENASVDRQGNFSWKNVNPGTYVLQVYGGDGKDNVFLKSARIGDRSIDARLSVSGPATLDLLASAKTGLLEGAVTDRDEQGNDVPASNVTVVAVPEERYRKIPAHFGLGATDQYGRFAIYGLPPGNYTVFAWQDVERELYYDPDFLKSQQANGTSIKVAESSHASVQLKLSPIGDDWR